MDSFVCFNFFTKLLNSWSMPHPWTFKWAPRDSSRPTNNVRSEFVHWAVDEDPSGWHELDTWRYSKMAGCVMAIPWRATCICTLPGLWSGRHQMKFRLNCEILYLYRFTNEGKSSGGLPIGPKQPELLFHQTRRCTSRLASANKTILLWAVWFHP